jgi:aminotransferase
LDANSFSRQTEAFQTPALRRVTLRVNEVNGINLGQGVCNLPLPKGLGEAAARAMRDGLNRYTDPRGLIQFREAVAEKLDRDNGITVDPAREIVATCGATGAFEAVCGVFLNPGDRVVAFEPSYPYHLQGFRRYSSSVDLISIRDNQVDWDSLTRATRSNPKLVLLNTPGNPSGKVWSFEEIDRLAKLLEPTETLLVTDEIYEYMVFDGRRHVSPASHPLLRDRTITMGGFSKTYAITGWRLGYLAFPKQYSRLLAAFCDAVYVCPPAPLQAAVASYLREPGAQYLHGLSKKYQEKRDLMFKGLKELGFEPELPQGAYYMKVGYEGVLGRVDPIEAADILIDRAKIGAVPANDFVRNIEGEYWLRFCLAQEDGLLLEALSSLQKVNQ